MPHILPDLPYDYDALAPHISAETLRFHHDKHHQTYVTNLNAMIKDTPNADHSLEHIIQDSFGDSAKAGMFNNAAQIWNHTFYWHSMRAGGGGLPTGAIGAKIDSDLGGYDKFVDAFKQAGATQFGSGWAWLVVENGHLKVTKTANAELPLTKGQHALITMDVWEHAYYLDFQNRRPDYIGAFLGELINWDFANENLARA
ncbi:MAG: superoxide dismutase [Pseudomonadota bacterium]